VHHTWCLPGMWLHAMATWPYISLVFLLMWDFSPIRLWRRAVAALPTTYTRILDEIDEQNWEYVHRLFQCVAAASRPLLVGELAEFLAFDFEAGSTPTVLPGWRLEDPTHAVISMCSSLLAVVKPHYGSPVVQFAHFSVKEYLMSARLAKATDTISRFHVSMIAAHTIVAKACLGVLLHIDENVTKDGLEKIPLAEYAAEHWVGHAQFENVSLKVQDGMKRLFDPGKSHISVWVWLCDPEDLWLHPERSECPLNARATPLHYAAFCGMHDVAEYLILEHSRDVNVCGFDKKETPLHVASRCRHKDVAQLLLGNGADTRAQDDDVCTPLHRASEDGHVEVARVLLEHGADTEASDYRKRTPLLLASEYGYVEVVRVLLDHGADTEARDQGGWSPLELASFHGSVDVARVLLGHGADTNALYGDNLTPLHFAQGQEVSRLLLEHGADANALDAKGRSPLHQASEHGDVGAARVLLEHGVDANARDANNATPLHLASRGGHPDVVRLLLQYSADIHAQDDKGRTPFMRTTAKGDHSIMQLLSEYGAMDSM
jgi:ankyrin repeat protein